MFLGGKGVTKKRLVGYGLFWKEQRARMKEGDYGCV